MPNLKGNHTMLAIRQLEFEPADEIVRRVLIVVENEVAANGRDLGREADSQRPTGDVELMHALIAEISIAIREIPVPVIVESFLRERLRGSRTGPEVVVHASGHPLLCGTADRVKPFE